MVFKVSAFDATKLPRYAFDPGPRIGRTWIVADGVRAAVAQAKAGAFGFPRLFPFLTADTRFAVERVRP